MLYRKQNKKWGRYTHMYTSQSYIDTYFNTYKYIDDKKNKYRKSWKVYYDKIIYLQRNLWTINQLFSIFFYHIEKYFLIFIRISIYNKTHQTENHIVQWMENKKTKIKNNYN